MRLLFLIKYRFSYLIYSGLVTAPPWSNYAVTLINISRHPILVNMHSDDDFAEESTLFLSEFYVDYFVYGNFQSKLLWYFENIVREMVK